MYTIKNIKLNMKDAEMDIFGSIFFNSGMNLVSFSHFHQYPEIHIITKGECTIECASKIYNLTKGECCIIPKLLPHKVVSVSEDVEKHTFMFYLTRKKGADPAVYNELNSAFSLKNAMIIKKSELLFDPYNIEETIKNNNSLNSLKLQSHFTLFIISLAEKLKQISGSEKSVIDDDMDDRIFDIEEYINQNYNNPSISLSTLSENINLCERQINRILLEHCGYSFKDLLTQYRMWRARELLADKDFPLLDIPEKLGYTSYSGFYYSVKKFWGVSPQDFRDSLI